MMARVGEPCMAHVDSGPAPVSVYRSVVRLRTSELGSRRRGMPWDQSPVRNLEIGDSVGRDPGGEWSFGLLEECDARREAVHEVLAADRADLAHGEEAGDRDRTEDLVDQAHVVIGLVEEPRAATVAGEQQGTERDGWTRRACSRASSRLSRRSSSAVSASRTWNWMVCPTRTRSVIWMAPESSAPITLRTRKSPRWNDPWYSLITRPMCRPSWICCCSSAE